jgi:hypothetical protein
MYPQMRRDLVKPISIILVRLKDSSIVNFFKDIRQPRTGHSDLCAWDLFQFSILPRVLFV